MMDFDIKGLVPHFLWNDRNGHALAKALEAGLNDFLAACKIGLNTWGNVDDMVEWRLDELAWEYNCLYDYAADVEQKRIWIREATPYYAVYGTVQAIKQYLQGVFSNVEVEESFSYGGDPFHFRVTISGTLTRENAIWAYKAISAAKNVRSVLDNMAVGGGGKIEVSASSEVVAKILYPKCGELLCGEEQWDVYG